MARRNGDIGSITIEGSVIEVTYEEVPLGQVVLDAGNPRIRDRVKALKKTPSPKELRDLILGLNGVDDHRRSIRENKGLLEPIYVWNDGRVAEGNCRAAIYLDLGEHQPTEACWKKIPAFRLPPSTTPRQVAVLQGTFHVIGKTTWGALEKAGHITFMHNELKLDVDTIARLFASSVKEVERALAVHATMQANHLPPERFSHFEEFYKIKKLSDYRGTPAQVKQFVELVSSGALPKGSDVRKFAEICHHPKAMSALKSDKKDGLKKALEVLGRDDPAIDSSVFRAIKKITAKLNELTRPELEQIKKQPKKQEAIQELFSALNEVASQSGFKLK